MVQKVLGLIAATVAALAFSLPAVAADASSPGLARIVSTGNLRVGMIVDQPPLNVKS